MDPSLAFYIFNYYGQFMSPIERLAYRHLAGAIKATRGRSDLAAQAEAKKSLSLASLLSDDPAVLLLAKDGFDQFVLRTGQRLSMKLKYFKTAVLDANSRPEHRLRDSAAGAVLIGTDAGMPIACARSRKTNC